MYHILFAFQQSYMQIKTNKYYLFYLEMSTQHNLRNDSTVVFVFQNNTKLNIYFETVSCSILSACMTTQIKLQLHI